MISENSKKNPRIYYGRQNTDGGINFQNYSDFVQLEIFKILVSGLDLE